MIDKFERFADTPLAHEAFKNVYDIARIAGDEVTVEADE